MTARLLVVAMAALMPHIGVDGPAEAASRTNGHVVMIGIPGLAWDDIDPANTPALWRLAASASIANIAVRTVSTRSCPIDGWMTLSAGAPSSGTSPACSPPPVPQAGGTNVLVPEHETFRRRNQALGQLADAVHDSGGCVAAVGPGAALAGAGSTGLVDVYQPAVRDVAAAAWSRCGLSIVELGHIGQLYAGADGEHSRVTASRRATAAAEADRALAVVLAHVPREATVLVAAVSDSIRPQLRPVLATGPSMGGETYLTSPATRRPGLVKLTDLTATLLHAVAAPRPPAIPDSRILPADVRPSDAVELLMGDDRAARTTRSLVTPVFTALVAGQVLLYGLGLLLLRRNSRSSRARLGRFVRIGAIAAASAPVAMYLVNLLPWWGVPVPAPIAKIAGLIVAGGLVAILALRGPWRRNPLGPALAVASVTALVMAIDVVTGSNLQLNSMLGNYSLHAGRLYGLGNEAFAVYATAVLVGIAVLAGHLRWQGRPGLAIVAVIGLGAAAVVVDGWPGWGADVGGVLALTPGVALLALLTAGARLTIPRVALMIAAGLALISAVAYLDLLRPPERRTHLGAFWERLMNGEAWADIVRKADMTLHSLGSPWVTVLAPLPVLAAAIFLLGPSTRRPAALQSAFRSAPGLRHGLVAALFTLVLAAAVNDSGPVVIGLGLLIAAPLTVAVALAGTSPPAGSIREVPQVNP